MRRPETELADEVRAILAHHGADEGHALEAVEGFANVVVACGDVVVRLNSGRLVHAFAHEAEVLRHLPSSIPHASVIAHGQRSEFGEREGEYLVLTRLRGRHAESQWASMSADERRECGRGLGQALLELHAMPAAPWMTNPWSERALAERRWADAYHAPEERAPELLASARGRVAGTDELLDRVDAMLAGLALEPAGDPTFVHTDLHLRNVLWTPTDGASLVDFEGARLGTMSMELDMLLRSAREFDQWELLTGLRDTYPDLLDLGRVANRLVVAEAMWHLVQLHHWQPGQTWTRSPIEGLTRVVDGSFMTEVLPAGL